MRIRLSIQQATLFGLLAVAIVWFASLPLAEAASITLATSPTTDTIADIVKGSQKVYTVTIVGEKYEPGVQLTLEIIKIAPSGVPLSAAVFSPSSVTVLSGATGFNHQVTLTVSTTVSTPPGTYTVIARGKFANNATVPTNNLTLTLNVGDFAVSVIPSTIEVRQLSSSSALVNVSSISNFNAAVSLSWVWTSQTPLGVTATISTPTVTVPKQSWTSTTLRFDAALNAPAGQSYTGLLVGTYSSAGITFTQSFQVTVIIKSLPALSISITASPSPAVVFKVSTLTIRVTSDGIPIDLASLTISSTASALGSTSGLTDVNGQFLTALNSTVPGQITISVTATKSGYIAGSNSLVLNVVGNFRISISPAEATLNLGATRTFQITVQSIDGFNSAVVFLITPPLKGVNATIVPAVVTPPPNGVVTATLIISLNLTATPGTQEFTITASRAPLLGSAILRLSIPVRDFALAISPAKLIIAQGQQGFYNVSVISRGGFSGPIDIRVLGLPDDVESSIVPNVLNLEVGATRSLILSVKTTEQTRAGSFLFVIEANSQGSVRRSIQGILEILPLFRITIDSSPKVSAITVDGIEISLTDLPKQFKWVKGETHVLGIPKTIIDGTIGIRYVFTRWSDGTPTLSRTVMISDNTVYKAEFKTQFFLTVKTSIPEGALPSTGAGWYDNGTQAKITTLLRIEVTSDRRYDFRGWTGDISDPKSNTTVLVNKPKTVISSYMLQFFVKAVTNPAGLSEVVNGNKWHDSDSTIELTTTKRVGDHSFRFWIIDGKRATGLPVSVKVEKPLLATANYVHLPKVGITWANVTVSRTEFQGESAYLWLKMENSKDRSGEVRLDVRSTLDGMDINPKSVVLNFEAGQSYLLAFELRFQKEGTGTFEAKINETAAGAQDTISVPLKVFPRQSRDNMRAIGKAVSVEVLPRLNDLMTPTPEVKSLAERILAIYNVPLDAGTIEKAKALLRFVVQHYEPGPSVNPSSISKIASEIESRGGALSDSKMIGDSRTAQIFYGGLLRSLDMPVRPVIGTMEMSPTNERAYLAMHSWIEFRAERDWIFADPSEGVLDLSNIIFPSNIQKLARDSKLFYELNPRFGGPIAVLAYEGRPVDITERYKLSGYASLQGTVVFTKGDASLAIRDDSGKDFAHGVNYAVLWMPIEPQSAEIRAMKPEGQLVLIEPNIPLSKYAIFVSGPKRTDYTFQVMDTSLVFPTINSMQGSFLDRDVNEHSVRTNRDGRLQVEQVERLSYADNPVTVASNSTITSALPSQDIRAVRMTVVGKEGTSGFLNVTVPKKLLIDELGSSPEKIVVLLDNKFATPEIINFEDKVVISLSYKHSTRNVVAYLKTFTVSFDTRDPFGLTIYDAEITMEGPVTRKVKESSNPVFKPLIPGQYQFTIKYRGEKQVISQTITDRDIILSINLLRSDATIAAFAAGIVIAVFAIALTTQLLLSRIFQRKATS